MLFSSFLIYLFFGIYVYRLNRAGLTNRSFFVLCLNLSCWALGYAMMNSADSAVQANYWRLFSAAGFCFFYSSWLYFCLILTRKEEIFKKAWFRLALYIPSLVFFLNNIVNPPEIFVQNFLGWTYLFEQQHLIQYAFILYYALFLLGGLLLIIFWGKNSHLPREKKQAKIILITVVISICIGVPLDTLLPIFGVQINPMAIVFLGIATWGIWYAIVKYKMMVLTPEVAADYILETMNDPVIFVNTQFIIKDVNKAVLDLSHFRRDELIGMPLSFLIGSKDEATMIIQRIMQLGSVRNIELELRTKKMASIPCLFSGSMLIDNIGDYLGMACVFHDITDRKIAETYLKEANSLLETEVAKRTAELEKINQQLKDEIIERTNAQLKLDYAATHDELTGLPNRRLFDITLDQAIHQMQRIGNQLAVYFFDLDNFKLINDSYGHNIGDLLLRQTADKLQAILRKSDYVARIGGDEFMILATNIKRENDVEIITRKLRSVFEKPFNLDGHESFITASIGIAIYPRDGHDGQTLSRNADIAMYEAKSSGKNTYQLCSEEIKDRFIERTIMRNHLYHAIERDELSIHYHPQIDVKTQRITGFEALMRWKHNDQNISPSEFIPLAEETGLIIPMGEWIIHSACTQVKKWQELGHDKLNIAINLSENQLKEKGFAQKVATIINKTGFDPNLLEFEITERIVFRGNEDAIKTLYDLKNMGIALSIDDFGIDHSSFLNIKKLPIDKIKIPMEFIQGIPSNRKDAAIVDSIIELSHKMGLEVIAEGVEMAEQMAFIKDACCDTVQGYYLYKPMLHHEIEHLLMED
ncbi:EAL domain-containing protein [Dehalobacter sp. DCM]|nr:EAL domain-containing protein [Dehalobacter sp. DCM]